MEPIEGAELGVCLASEQPTVVLPPFGTMRVIRAWGSDQSIIEAARMSTDKGFLGWEPGPCSFCEGTGEARDGRSAEMCTKCDGKGSHIGDLKLLTRLWTMRHSTPFEMAGLEIEVQAPIFVFREWHRHRTQSYSEMSARYTPLPDMDYVPSFARVLNQHDGSNKQAMAVKGSDVLTPELAQAWLLLLHDHNKQTQKLYEHGLRIGVPKELARLPLSVARYTRMRAATDLRNWLAFLTLRYDPAAQYEIRVFAEQLHEFLSRIFPRTLKIYDADRNAFKEYKANEKEFKAWMTQRSSPLPTIGHGG